MTAMAELAPYSSRDPLARERHYTPAEVAEMWGLHPKTVRKMFQHVPGVLKVAQERLRGKRPYVSLRIPESLLLREHRERSR